MTDLEPRCHEQVWDSHSMSRYQCSRRGAVREGGYLWCKQHLPSAVKARREASLRKWKEENERQNLLYSTKVELIQSVLDAAELPLAVRLAKKAYKRARGLS